MLSPALQKLYNQMAVDLSSALFKLLRDYPGHEAEMCRMMTGQLGSLIAVATKDPEKALAYYAQILTNIDWEPVRRDYFANTLGVDTTVKAPQSLSEVIQLDRRREPAAPDQSSAERSGDPARQKPDE